VPEAQGAAWAAVGWGVKQSTSLTKADEQDQGGGATGAARVEAAARTNPVEPLDDQIDDELYRGGDAYDRMMGRDPVH